MPWTPFASRSTQLQQRLTEHARKERISGSAEEFYNDFELGLLSDDELATWISDRLKSGSFSESALALPILRDGDSYEVMDLGWLQDNAASAEDKAWATNEYRKILFKLWRMHIASTGEAWYPPLLNDLRDKYLSLISSKRSSI
jgi:hypothetical protein